MSDTSDTDSSRSSLSGSSSLSSLSEEIDVLRQLSNMDKIIEIEEIESGANGDVEIDILPFINLLFQVDNLDGGASTSSSDGLNSIIGSPTWHSSNSSPNPQDPASSEALRNRSYEGGIEDDECPPSPATSNYESDEEINSADISQHGNEEYPQDPNIGSNSALDVIPPRLEAGQSVRNTQDTNSAEGISKKNSRHKIPKHEWHPEDPEDNISDSDLDVLSLTCSSLSSLSSPNLDSDKD